MPYNRARGHEVPWTAKEDEVLIAAVNKAVNERGQTAWAEVGRLLALEGLLRSQEEARHRLARITKGKRAAEEGKARNRCKRCGQIRAGHTCGVPQTSLVLPTRQPRRPRPKAKPKAKAKPPAVQPVDSFGVTSLFDVQGWAASPQSPSQLSPTAFLPPEDLILHAVPLKASDTVDLTVEADAVQLGDVWVIDDVNTNDADWC